MGKPVASIDDDVITTENARVAPRGEATADDPHIVAAVDDSSISNIRLGWSTWISIFFLGLSSVAPISTGFIVISSLIVTVGEELGGLELIGWIISGWSIASSVSFAVAGNLSDIYGRRYVMLSGQALSVVGSIVGGTAQSMSAVIAGSTLLGFSCGLVLVLYAGIPELLPFRYRGIGLAWSEVCLHVPWVIVGTLIGRELAEHATWRWCYYIGVIYGATAFVGTALFYFPPLHSQQETSKSRWHRIARIDYASILLYSGGLSVLLLGISWGGSEGHDWASASVVAPIVIGALTFIASFVYSWTVANQETALFPKRLFRKIRQLTVMLVVLLVAGMIYYSMSALLPEATTYVFTADPIQVGIIELPYGFGQFVGSSIMTSLIAWTKRPKYHIVAAITIQTIFCALYAYGIEFHQSAWMAFQFFGQGCFAWITVSTLVVVSLHVNQADLGVAVGLCGAFRSLGGSIGNAIFGAILNSVAPARIETHMASAAALAGQNASAVPELVAATSAYTRGNSTAFVRLPTITDADIVSFVQAYRAGWAGGFRLLFLVTIAFGAIAIVASLFIEDVSQYMTNHTHVHLEKRVLGRKAQEQVDGKTV